MSDIDWDLSTAYDFFVSLTVLHEPADWQLRGSWAAGVRSRLSAENREFLHEVYPFLLIPVALIAGQQIADGAALLNHLAQVPAADRLQALMNPAKPAPDEPHELQALFERVAAAGAYTDDDVAELLKHARQMRRLTRRKAQTMLHWWSHRVAFGERILPALTEYYEAFFAEEETRIRPALVEGLEQAQALAETMDAQPLVEHLAQGVRFERFPSVDKLLLVPSFWATPLIISGPLAPREYFYLFGVRPEDASIVPGEQVPDALYRALKALADPTRLRILRYLAAEPQTPAQLSRKLRLRPPTVVHHLHTLRIAGLVEITFTSEDKRRYAARPEAIDAALASARDFLSS